MKQLSPFIKFDVDAFMRDKDLTAVGIKDLFAYVDGKPVGDPIGKKVECVITRDDTPYKPAKDGSPVTNLFERVSVKVLHNVNPDIIGCKVTLENAVGTVYGDYRNNLAISAENILPITQSTTKEK